MSAKVVNRYTLVLKDETNKTYCYDPSSIILYVEELKNKLKKLNDKNKGYLYGNVRTTSATNVLYDRYRKLDLPNNLVEIDDFTTTFVDENDLKEHYGVLDKNPISIAYRASGDVRTLPVFYSQDKDLLDMYVLRERIMELANDLSFIDSLVSNKLIAASIHGLEDEFYALKSSFELNMFKGINKDLLVPTSEFYSKFINNNGSLNYLHLRLLANLVSSYTKRNQEEKKKEEIKVKKLEIPENAQISMFDWAKNNGYKLK